MILPELEVHNSTDGLSGDRGVEDRHGSLLSGLRRTLPTTTELSDRPLCRSNRIGPLSDRRPELVEGKLGDVTSRTGRIALILVGVIALIIGGVFAGQGMNLIPGSFMTGSRMWLSIGLVLAVAGIILIVLGLRRPGHGRTNR